MTKIQLAYGVGTPQVQVLPPPQFFESTPTGSNWTVGQIGYTGSVGAYTFYIYAGNDVWEILDSASGDILTITGNSGGAETPDSSGNFNIVGTGSITVAGSTNTETVQLTGLTNHALLVGAGTATITKLALGTNGQILTGATGADPAWTTATYPATATAGSLLAATATNVIGQIADVATGQVLASGGVGVLPAYTATPSVTSITTATGLTATTAGAGITLNSQATSGTTTATLNGRSGQITITTPTINAGATFTMTIANTSITGSSTQVLYGLTGGTTGSAITIQSVTNSANQSQVVLQNASAVTNSTGSLVLTFLVLN